MHFLILQQFFPRVRPLRVWVSLSDQWLNTVEADTQYQLDTARKVLLVLGGERASRRSLATGCEPTRDLSVATTLQRLGDLGGFSWKGARRGDGDLGCDSVVENVLSVFKFHP